MCKRVVTKCKNRKCRQQFGVTKITKLFQDHRAKCPFCKFLNKLPQRQVKKIKSLV